MRTAPAKRQATYAGVLAATGGQWLLGGTAAGRDDVRLAAFDAISFPLTALCPLDPPDTDPEDA